MNSFNWQMAAGGVKSAHGRRAKGYADTDTDLRAVICALIYIYIAHFLISNSALYFVFCGVWCGVSFARARFLLGRLVLYFAGLIQSYMNRALSFPLSCRGHSGVWGRLANDVSTSTLIYFSSGVHKMRASTKVMPAGQSPCGRAA